MKLALLVTMFLGCSGFAQENACLPSSNSVGSCEIKNNSALKDYRLNFELGSDKRKLSVNFVDKADACKQRSENLPNISFNFTGLQNKNLFLKEEIRNSSYRLKQHIQIQDKKGELHYQMDLPSNRGSQKIDLNLVNCKLQMPES